MSGANKKKYQNRVKNVYKLAKNVHTKEMKCVNKKEWKMEF